MQRIHNALVGAGGLGLLVAGLMAIDSDVRRHVMNIVAGNTSELELVAAPVNRAAHVAFKTLNDYRTDDGPLFAFAAAAVVLFGFLFKS